MLKTSTLQITPEMLALVAKIDEFKGAWRALGTLAPERLSALRRIATIEGIGSSTRIEGSRLSDRELEHLLSNLEIHPFQDGNGRLSRVLTTLLLLRAGYAYVPFSSLESVIEQSKERENRKGKNRDRPEWH